MATYPPPAPNDPFLRNYGQDWLSKIYSPVFTESRLNEMAADEDSAAELMTMLLNTQYGRGGRPAASGGFGDYLRNQAGQVSTIAGLFDTLSAGGAFGGGSAERGGPARTWEDIYESLNANPSGAPAGSPNISDWRNLVYGGAGAMRPGGIMGGGSIAGKLAGANPRNLAEASSYLRDYIFPLLGATMTRSRQNMLESMLPDLLLQYQTERGTNLDPNYASWGQWLRNNKYLPTQAL